MILFVGIYVCKYVSHVIMQCVYHVCTCKAGLFYVRRSHFKGDGYQLCPRIASSANCCMNIIRLSWSYVIIRTSAHIHYYVCMGGGNYLAVLHVTRTVCYFLHQFLRSASSSTNPWAGPVFENFARVVGIAW